LTARRTVPSRKSSEVAAIALGVKRALCAIPPSWRKQVLILSDSEYALDFFCTSEKPDESKTKTAPKRRDTKKRRKGAASIDRGKRQTTQSMERREEAHRRSLQTLLAETPRGISFAKVRSSSRGVAISDELDDTPWNGIGFIDHDAADYLSSITRSFANSNDNEQKFDNSSGWEELPFFVVESLSDQNIAWLKNSDEKQTITANKNERIGPRKSSASNFWKTIKVVGSEARDDRQKRSHRKTKIIHEMLGPTLLNWSCFEDKQ